MTFELAKKIIDYWAEKKELYQCRDYFLFAYENPFFYKLLKRINYPIPGQKKLKQLVQRIKKDKKDRHEKYITVTDNWHPCYPINKIYISFYPKDNFIYASGSDDFGMSKQNATFEEFCKIVKMKNLNQDIFKSMGFEVDC